MAPDLELRDPEAPDPEAPDPELRFAEPGAAGLITMSLASFAPAATGPPTKTCSPSDRAPEPARARFSRITVSVTRSQVQVVPSAARTVTMAPVTD